MKIEALLELKMVEFELTFDAISGLNTQVIEAPHFKEVNRNTGEIVFYGTLYQASEIVFELEGQIKASLHERLPDTVIAFGYARPSSIDAVTKAFKAKCKELFEKRIADLKSTLDTAEKSLSLLD